MKKYCTKCGHEFEAVGREVICPACKQAAAEESKRAAVLRAKRASWTGESVPVRISGRASTVIREFGASHTMTFAEALDELLKASDYFKGTGSKWEEVEPYRSRRRDKHTTQDEQDVKQDAPQASKPQGKAQDAQDGVQAAQAAKASKSVSKAASKSSSKSSKAK